MGDGWANRSTLPARVDCSEKHDTVSLSIQYGGGLFTSSLLPQRSQWIEVACPAGRQVARQGSDADERE